MTLGRSAGVMIHEVLKGGNVVNEGLDTWEGEMDRS